MSMYSSVFKIRVKSTIILKCLFLILQLAKHYNIALNEEQIPLLYPLGDLSIMAY